MKNLESFENFKNEEIENLDAALGGELLRCRWTDGTNSGDDLYDTEARRVIYL